MEARRIRRDDRIGWRDVALAVVLFAVLFKAFLAPGLMPDAAAAARGEFRLVICTVDGLKTLDGDARGPTHADDAIAKAQGACAFAAAPASGAPPQGPILSLPQSIALKLAVVDSTPAAAPAPAWRPQAPRGPPSVSA